MHTYGHMSASQGPGLPPPPVARAGVSYQFEAGQSAPHILIIPFASQYNPALFPALPYQH